MPDQLRNAGCPATEFSALFNLDLRLRVNIVSWNSLNELIAAPISIMFINTFHDRLQKWPENYITSHGTIADDARDVTVLRNMGKQWDSTSNESSSYPGSDHCRVCSTLLRTKRRSSENEDVSSTNPIVYTGLCVWGVRGAMAAFAVESGLFFCTNQKHRLFSSSKIFSKNVWKNQGKIYNYLKIL